MRFPCNLPVLVVRHGRDEIFPRPWQEFVTAVERSNHGRGKVKIPVLQLNNTAALAEQCCCFNGTILLLQQNNTCFFSERYQMRSIHLTGATFASQRVYIFYTLFANIELPLFQYKTSCIYFRISTLFRKKSISLSYAFCSPVW